MLILFRTLHPSKALLPILSTLSGIVISVNVTQELNADSPIDWSPDPSFTVARLLQRLNAESPILVTLSGIVISVNEIQ